MAIGDVPIGARSLLLSSLDAASEQAYAAAMKEHMHVVVKIGREAPFLEWGQVPELTLAGCADYFVFFLLSGLGFAVAAAGFLPLSFFSVKLIGGTGLSGW